MIYAGKTRLPDENTSATNVWVQLFKGIELFAGVKRKKFGRLIALRNGRHFIEILKISAPVLLHFPGKCIV
jgi:hypothetical protein